MRRHQCEEKVGYFRCDAPADARVREQPGRSVLGGDVVTSYMGEGLIEGSGDPFPVSYSLEVYESGHLKGGDGEMSCDHGQLAQAFKKGTLTLVMQGGVRVPVIITGFSGTKSVQFRLAGAPVSHDGVTAKL